MKLVSTCVWRGEKEGAYSAFLEDITSVDVLDHRVQRCGRVRDRCERRLDEYKGLRTRAGHTEGGDAGEGEELAKEAHADQDSARGGNELSES